MGELVRLIDYRRPTLLDEFERLQRSWVDLLFVGFDRARPGADVTVIRITDAHAE